MILGLKVEMPAEPPCAGSMVGREFPAWSQGNHSVFDADQCADLQSAVPSAWRSFAQRAKAQQEVTFDGVTGGTPWIFPQMVESGYQKM
jgi:hypothetical protein